MMGKSVVSLRKRLIKRANELAERGYSVIPVHGNGRPQQPKKPAIKWRKYQRVVASGGEIESFFADDVTALGIVCGRVSRLFVIDFDDLLGYQKFCRRFPEYVATYTVKTNRGLHLYFHTDEKVPSHQFSGGDIKGERSYVIAPPSEINEFQYRIVKDASPLEVGGRDVNEMLNVLQSNQNVRRVVAQEAGTGAKVDVRVLYRRLAVEIGRNNALYRCASIARDEGRKENEVVALLADIHVWTADRNGNRAESVESRLREAGRTIASAFSKRRGISVYGSGIPNSLRELLLREQGSTVLARLLEVFRLAKWKERDWFELREATAAAARFGLNRKSVLEALGGEASVFNGEYMIRRRYVEYLDKRGQKSRGRGRPCQILYQVPAMADLMRRLGVRWSPSDRIVGEDIRSAHSYRLALHREYIKRLAPEVPKSWLAKRIGVCGRTISRYNRELKVSVVEKVARCRLTGDFIDSLPQRRSKDRKNATSGYWLELGDGRKFPAWRHIGSWLLKSGSGGVMICMRRPSRYEESGEENRVEYERSNVAEFVKARVWREAGGKENRLLGAVRRLADMVKRRLSVARAERVPLVFESVAGLIAPDKVAETIKGWLFAYDRDGRRVERPAKRGIAYRMLKQFGEGNVYLACGEGEADVLLAFARRALRMGEAPRALELLMRAIE